MRKPLQIAAGAFAGLLITAAYILPYALMVPRCSASTPMFTIGTAIVLAGCAR